MKAKRERQKGPNRDESKPCLPQTQKKQGQPLTETEVMELHGLARKGPESWQPEEADRFDDLLNKTGAVFGPVVVPICGRTASRSGKKLAGARTHEAAENEEPEITARSMASDIEAIGRTLFGRRTKAKETTYNRLASRLAEARVKCPALFEACLGECGQPVRKAILGILNPQEALNNEEGETHA
ncbi:MAG TPA: hypothetical protein PLE77_02965 [Kiritimatiellia bacterium]|nr:hypothetical protein [Kiritimatiellia bacterium]